MTPTCPRCGSVDLHSSRSRDAADRVFRFIGFPPRRCSACGWRGYRLRLLAPADHVHGLPLSEEGGAPASAPPSHAEPVSSHYHRQRHRRRRTPRVAHRPTSGFRLVLLILLCGLGTALIVDACSTMDSPFWRSQPRK